MCDDLARAFAAQHVDILRCNAPESKPVSGVVHDVREPCEGIRQRAVEIEQDETIVHGCQALLRFDGSLRTRIRSAKRLNR